MDILFSEALSCQPQVSQEQHGIRYSVIPRRINASRPPPSVLTELVARAMVTFGGYGLSIGKFRPLRGGSVLVRLVDRSQHDDLPQAVGVVVRVKTINHIARCKV